MVLFTERHADKIAGTLKATLPVSKTQARVIPLVSCRRHLAAWVNCHPAKDNPDAALWSNLKGDSGSALQPQTAGAILRRVALRAGIRKRV